VVQFFSNSLGHLSLELSGPFVFSTSVVARQNARTVQKQEFEMWYVLEIDVLLLHMYACNGPVNIHLDGFVSLSSVYIIAIFKV